MGTALLVGGTRFIGRHTVEELLAADYDVTVFTRGRHENPFADADRVTHVRGDRNDREALERARDEVDPDVVFDLFGMVPEQVTAATEVFADVDAYVLVSSAAAYARPDLPAREGETPLHEYGPEHAPDDPADVGGGLSPAYGPRKAECDRVVFAASDRGVNATSVRPGFVYGPHDYTARFDYWVDRANAGGRVLVPGDGDYIAHHAYVADVASALRVVAERGSPGEAYNVADRTMLTLDGKLRALAAALDTEVTPVHASPRELAAHDLEPMDFPLVMPVPVLLATEKLAALGWTSTPHAEAYAATVEESLAADREVPGPDPALERATLDALG